MLNIFTARSQQQLETAVFDKIKERLELLKNGKLQARRILLIVPAQFTLKAEEESFERIGGQGFFDFHIMSGNKLLETILRETGGPGLVPINTLGRAMLLRRIASENADRFKRFARLARDRDFLKLAGDFIVQMKQNRMEASDMKALLASVPEGSLLYEKLSDMDLIYQGYDKAMEGRFTDSEDRVRYVTNKISSCRYIKESELWYFGFYSFTAREADLMAQLAKESCGLNLMLLKGDPNPEDDQLFQAPHKAAAQLQKAMAAAGVQTKFHSLPKEPQPESKTILLEASNPFTQAETVGAEILRLAREEKVPFGEIAVLTADGSPQTQTLQRVFDSLGIPMFLDSKRSMMHSPAAALLSALLDMSADGLKEENVISFLKQGLVPLADEDTCLDLENYVRQYHLKGKAFLNPLKYGRDRLGEETFAALEALRSAFADTVTPFLDAFRSASTAEERCRALYHYLDENLHLPQTLEQTAVTLAEEAMADEAEETAQCWSSICSLLDQTVELMGQEPLSAKDFRDLIEDALTDIKIGVLPQAEGRVQMGTVTRSRLQGIRYLFVCGMNEGEIPSDPNHEALLTEKELEGLEDLGYLISKRNQVLAAEEDLAIHTALEQPVESRWFCWCKSSPSGEALKPSDLITEYRASHPDCPVLCDIENGTDPLPFLQGEASARGRLFAELRKAADTGADPASISPIWKASYNLLKESSPALKAAPELLYFDPACQPLTPEAVQGLFADRAGEYAFSPSRLETFAACPFSHFISYGLRPEEEKSFEIDSLQAGNIYHDLMMLLSRALSKKAMEEGLAITHPDSLWMTISEEDLQSLIDRILESLKTKGYDGLLSMGHTQIYQTDRIRKVAMDFARQMVRQVRQGQITAMYFEKAFGRGKELPPVKISTPAGIVNIEGRIDRMDMLPGPDGDYIKIIDYKSGRKEFKKDQVEKGLALQLSTYLEGGLDQNRRKAAGMFFFRIKEASLEGSLAELLEENLSPGLAEQIAKEYSLSGLVVNEPFVLDGMDKNIREAGSSDIIGYTTRELKSGERKVSCSALISREDFEAFRSDFRKTLEKLCSRLTEGEISPRQVRMDSNVTSCTWCPYKNICLKDIT